MKRIFTLILILISGSAAWAQQIVALTKTNQLITISNAAIPTVTSLPVTVTGLTAGQTLAGMDYRPNTGELFGLGYDTLNGSSQLYIINATTGVAVPVTATPFILALGNGSIGFDFNPTADRIRVVGSNGKNYRLNPNNTITATDTDLGFAAGDAHAGATPAVGACAYTNSFIASPTTTLYTYDETLNAVLLQNPPNGGVLNTVGSSGITVNANDRTVDMDIFYNAAISTNIAYLAANTTGSSADNLYTINLTSGFATNVGQIGLTGTAIKDIAVVIDRTLPALTGQLIYGLTSSGTNLLSFDSRNPSFLRSYTAITGLTAGQVLVGMDVRTADLKLYGLGYNTGTNETQMYMINTTSAAATPVNATPFSINLGGVNAGVDFNPVSDRMRVIGTNDSNFRISPVTGLVAARDFSLNYAAGDANSGNNPNVSGAAYINSYAGATATTLYVFDDLVAGLAIVNPPNNGTLTTVAQNILALNSADYTTDIDFYYDFGTSSNTGYLLANTGSSSFDSLFTITTAGVVTGIGPIGTNIALKDIAVQLASPPNGIASIEKTSFIIYPNPVHDKVNISLPAAAGEAELAIVDMTGRVVLKNIVSVTSTISVDVSGLQTGFYMVSVQSEGMKYAPSRFVKE
jgi:hypothetical protein